MVKVNGFNYMVFATSDGMKYFGCGVEGHLICYCLKRHILCNVIQNSNHDDFLLLEGGF